MEKGNEYFQVGQKQGLPKKRSESREIAESMKSQKPVHFEPKVERQMGQMMSANEGNY